MGHGPVQISKIEEEPASISTRLLWRGDCVNAEII